MNRLRTFVAIAFLAGCAATAPSGPVTHHAVGSALAASATETINLGATIRSAARYTGNVDTVGFAVRSTGTAAGTWSIQYSNDFASSVDDPTSDAKWDTYTSPSMTTPPAAAGSGQTFGVTIDAYEFQYVRLKFTYTSGSGSATVVTQLKGG